MKQSYLLHLEPQQVLVWTGVIVFIATSTITILALIGIGKTDRSYLDRLFSALILEIVASGVLAFRNSFKPTPKTEFIKIISPVNSFDALTIR